MTTTASPYDNPSFTANPRQGLMRAAALAGPILTTAFGAAVAMWIVAWVAHLPRLTMPQPLLLSLLTAIQLAACLLGAIAAGHGASIYAGAFGALGAAVLNLLIVGSLISEQPDSTADMQSAANQLKPYAGQIVFGFIFASTALGVVAGVVARFMTKGRDAAEPQAWLSRFARVAAVAFLPLLAVGGAVTSTESGMAVPDGFTTYGATSFLFPLSLMSAESRIFLEHTHRLFGVLVGLASLALMTGVLIWERRNWVKVFAVVVFALVCLQGVLGAFRVTENSTHAAMTHGVFGQLVFASAVWLTAVLSPAFLRPEPALPADTTGAARRAVPAVALAAAGLLVQLLTGAWSRHIGHDEAVWAHVGFSIFAASFVVAAAVLLRTAERFSQAGRILRGVGLALIVAVFFQFMLGLLTLWQVGAGSRHRPIPLANELATAHPIAAGEALSSTAHQTVGAVLVALVTLALAWALRLRAPSAR